jgi:superfamily II DNA or RNA helicase
VSKPEFLTNRPGELVADGIRGYLGFLRENRRYPYDLAVATAYFNLGGYQLLADELDHPRTIRILLGAEPPVPERRVRGLDEGRGERARLRSALAESEGALRSDPELLGFTLEAAQGAQRLIGWLRSERVEVKRLADRFLHGKAFIVTSDHEGVIAGSANFTYAGLTQNLELVLGRYEPGVVGDVATWFEELWSEAESYDLAALYEARFEPHSPYLIYLRMLWERYGREITEEAQALGASTIRLTRFQEDGLYRARRVLAEHRGVLIADEVGLGKTFLAGALIRDAVQQRRQRVLLVAPATLRDGTWRKFLLDHQLGVECISYDELADEGYRFPAEEYAMLVVDEGHNLRNPATLRAAALRKVLAGTPPKELVLLTATPVNNSLWDLYYLLAYFLKSDSVFADAGIRSLRGHFAAAMAVDPDDLTPKHLFDVLDAVAVRRTRPFVKQWYSTDRVMVDGIEVPITFPKPRPLKVEYDLDETLPGFFNRFAVAMGAETAETDAERIGQEEDGLPVLTFARYVPSRYRVGGGAEQYEVQVAGLLRSGLLKRFESSAYAFARTCVKMAQSHADFLNLLDAGLIATGKTLAEWAATDSDDLDALDEFVSRNGGDLEPARAYDIDALRADVEHDRQLLLSFMEEIASVKQENDPKLRALAGELATIVEQAEDEGIGAEDTRDKRKVLVFTYFADTVDWIVEYLEREIARNPALASYRGRLTATAGGRDGKEAALFGFAPRTTEAPPSESEDLFDVLVATDVLSEGVNLQQARHIINFDLPWNPMRLVQRHGRIDRIGSRHADVYLRCFFPDRQLDALLGLEARLHRKLAQAAATIGVGEVLPESVVAARDAVFTETREEIERLRAGDASFYEDAGERGGVQSGEEYRQELRAALDNPDLARRLKGLVWGSGSGMARASSETGFVFCARVGDRQQPQFRYVGYDHDGPVVVDEVLTCLGHAHPDDGTDTERVLSEETLERAYGAWAVARADVARRWNEASDPRALAPRVPKPMRDASDLVRSSRPKEMTLEEADALVERLEDAWPERIQKSIRDAMRAHPEDPVEQVRAVALVVAELGLEPSPPPEPLPAITEDDVHLVCWLAIVPA